MKQLYSLPFLGLLVTLSVGFINCGSNKEQVFGKVIVGDPIEGITIHLKQKDTGTIFATTTTNKFGFFLFTDVQKSNLGKDSGGESNSLTQLCNDKGQCSDFLPLDTDICKSTSLMVQPFCGGGRIATADDSNLEATLLQDKVVRYSDHLAFVLQDQNQEPLVQGRFKLKPSVSTSSVVVDLIDALTGADHGTNGLTTCDAGYVCFPIQTMGRNYVRLRTGMMENVPNQLFDTFEVRITPINGKSALMTLDATNNRLFVDVLTQ